jgi:hypothetical protein
VNFATRTAETQVAELGISCEACHGPGADHVRQHRNRPRKPGAEPDIVHPAQLSVARRDDICAGLENLGIVIDPRRNDVRGEAVISSETSPVLVRVIPPAEDLLRYI